MQNYNTVEKQYNEDGSNFLNYKVTLDNGRILYVPLDETNKEYKEIQQWILEGNTVIDNGGGE